MSVDNDKLKFYSGWDIDQLVTTNADNPKSVSSGTTAIYTITGSVLLPDFKVQFKPVGSSFWFDCGTNSTNGTIANLFTVSSFINGSSIFVTTSLAGTVRYFIWEDRIDYANG